MGSNCSSDKYNGCRFHKGGGRCHHPRKAQGARLPKFKTGEEAGTYCMWGERPFDVVDVVRATLPPPERNGGDNR
jgi:hypothetical protein